MSAHQVADGMNNYLVYTQAFTLPVTCTNWLAILCVMLTELILKSWYSSFEESIFFLVSMNYQLYYQCLSLVRLICHKVFHAVNNSRLLKITSMAQVYKKGQNTVKTVYSVHDNMSHAHERAASNKVQNDSKADKVLVQHAVEQTVIS